MATLESDRSHSPAVTEELIRRARKGDHEAFSRLLQSQEKRIFRIAYQMVGNVEDAKDVCQEVFIRIYRYLRKFKDERRFSTWIYRLSINASIDFIKRRPVGNVAISGPDGEDILDLSAPASDQERVFQQRELHQKVLDNLNRLSPAERAVFVLRDVHGLDVKEIARIKGISAITVRRHLSRARNHLKEILQGPGPESQR